jgi:hypothetical protein
LSFNYEVRAGRRCTALWFARIDEFFLRNIECQI